MRFFSNAGKKERERWILDRWIALAGLVVKDTVEDEGPDFIVNGVGIEVVEVLEPGRKRGDEHRADRDALAEGNPTEWRTWVDIEWVISEAHSWVYESIAGKAEKYRSTALGWVLLIYLNYGWWEETNWQALRAQVETDVMTFREIHAIGAGGNTMIEIKS